nr:tyrosine-type recombinase/integrase [Clostridium botulinum]
MEAVEPIRSEKKIQDLKKYLLGAGSMRNYALIVLGINTALRVSDMLSLTWQDVYDFEEAEFKSHVYIKEKKTGKSKKFLLNKNAVEALRRLKKKSLDNL